MNDLFIVPWTEQLSTTLWIVVMGFLVAMTCGWVGTFLIVRRSAMVGDAISHSLLPGIAIAFLWTQSRDSLPMFIGAALAGVLTVVLIEALQKSSRIKADASIGIIFSALFALGVVLISLYSDSIDLDAECVLYGEIAFIPLEPWLEMWGREWGPVPVWRMAILAVAVLILMRLFYKELLVTSFDSALAGTLGISPAVYHYGLTILLSLVIVSAFESVGAILVVAMVVFPGATGMLWSDRLDRILLQVPLWSALTAAGGFHLAYAWNVSIAGAMAVVAGAMFLLSWAFSPGRGWFWKRIRRIHQATCIF